MSDSVSSWTVKDGTAAARTAAIVVAADGSTLIPQTIPRANGGPVSTANPLPVALASGTLGALTVNQAPSALTNSASGNMSTTAAVIVPYSPIRKWLMITNRSSGTEVQDIGSSNVVAGGGIPLLAGGGFLFSGPGAAGPVYGVTTVASSPYSYVEA